MKSSTRRLGLLSILALPVMAGLTACQTTPRVQHTGSAGEVFVEGHASAGLTIDGVFNPDGSLDRSAFIGEFFPGTSIKLTDIRSAEAETGLIEVQATVENTSRTRERIEYRFRWIDERGMEVGAGTSGWRSQTVESREQRVLSGVARSPGTVAFQLFVRTYQPKK